MSGKKEEFSDAEVDLQFMIRQHRGFAENLSDDVLIEVASLVCVFNSPSLEEGLFEELLERFTMRVRKKKGRVSSPGQKTLLKNGKGEAGKSAEIKVGLSGSDGGRK